MTPSKQRDYNNAILVSQLLWRLMPKAMKELLYAIKYKK